ncbi:MAG: VOC family protein [Longimicrobiales bacterium]|nr:VOC family protein [Longimicrobiales bacterium]
MGYGAGVWRAGASAVAVGIGWVGGVIGLAALPLATAAQSSPSRLAHPDRATDVLVVSRPPDLPRLHHTHLNTLDADAALDTYIEIWPEGRRGEVAGFPAFVAAVPALFTEVSEPSAGAWDPQRHRAYPQSPFWHIGAFDDTTGRFEALEARGHTVLRLARHADDAEGVLRSGLAGDEPRPGGFGYLVGPDGALVEITGGPRTEPAFAHVHLFGEAPRCAANWYAEVLGFTLPDRRDPETGERTPRERYEPCEDARAAPTWPSLEPAGTIRGPTATIRHASGTISIYPRQCLGEHCEVDEPLVPSRGQVLDHIAFEVEDLGAWIRWLESRGVVVLEPRRPFGPADTNTTDAPDSVMIEGPDGLVIELVQGA